VTEDQMSWYVIRGGEGGVSNSIPAVMQPTPYLWYFCAIQVVCPTVLRGQGNGFAWGQTFTRTCVPDNITQLVGNPDRGRWMAVSLQERTCTWNHRGTQGNIIRYPYSSQAPLQPDPPAGLRKSEHRQRGRASQACELKQYLETSPPHEQ